MADFHADDKFGEGRPVFVGLHDPRHNDLLQYHKGEGGSYINDYLRRFASYGYQAAPIPKRVAELILSDLGITRFNNKEFIRINSDDELEGIRDEPMSTFLYLHDYTYWIYNLR